MKLFYEFGSVVQEMSFESFLIWSYGSPSVWWSKTIYATLKECILGNIQKLYGIRTSGSGDFRLKTFLILSSGSPFVQQTEIICAIS